MATQRFSPPRKRSTATSTVFGGELEAVAGSWQGAAATQFTSLMAQWNENAEKVNRALQDLADNLHATDLSMEHNEAETENSFSQLLGGL